MMPSVKEPDLALAGLALLFIFGLLIWYDRPVQSSRPSDLYTRQQDPPITGYAYESWLWQDPFGFNPNSYTERNQYYIEFGEDLEAPRFRYQIGVVPVGKKKESKDKKEESKRRKAEPEDSQCEYQLKKKIEDIEKKLQAVGNSSSDSRVGDPSSDSRKRVKILVPLLKVRPDPVDIENKELRTRDRYAVIAGLIESGYRSQEPDHLHFCSTQGNKEYDVHWEHFRYEPEVPPDADTYGKNETDQNKGASNDKSNHKPENKPDIIVAWMNSEIFTEDARFNRMSASLFKLEKISNINFSIYDLNNILDQKRSEELKDAITKNNFKSVKFIKSLINEAALLEKLTKELELRNIKESSEVIIITEQDSKSVRDLSNSFCESLSSSFDKDKPNGSAKGSSTCEIRNVSYLKGVDAYQQKLHKQDKDEDQAKKRATRLSEIDLNALLPLPIGPGQFDYFRRLAKQINVSHKKINLEKRDTGIKAVGIFGSDFYDELLILEALRAEMPNILVFTADLDAQMLHPQHWLSTRNLVVASSFDLLLKDKDEDDKEDQKQSYLRQFSPFRDSQQVSIFNSIKSYAQESGNTLPQVFEIGRSGFVRLAAVDENGKFHPPDDATRQTAQRLLLLAAIIALLILFQWGIRPNSRLSLCLLLYPLAMLVIAWLFITGKFGEPLSFTEGVSLWPTIFIQIVAILMAIAFFMRARKELDDNSESLSEQHFGNYGDEGEWELSKRVRYLVLALPTFIILLDSIIIYALNDVDPEGLQFWLCLLGLVGLGVSYFILKLLYNRGLKYKCKDCIDFNSIKHWIEKEDNQQGEAETDQDKNTCKIRRWLRKCFRSDARFGSCPKNDGDYLWWEYYHYGLFDHRISRVVSMWLFFSIIETILIYLLPLWPLPCRGSIACSWASWAGVLSFTFVMLLLFFILDAVRLSFYWIKKLRIQHPLLTGRNIQATSDYKLERLEKIVALVAERTQVVDRLIYYPMLCIMLMLFARISYFDNQDFPLSKAITFAASISLLFFSGFMLRYEANKLRRSVIQCVEDIGKNNRRLQPEVDAAKKRISEISEGAFQPMFEQPVMRALLIILVSIGLFAEEYHKLLG